MSRLSLGLAIGVLVAISANALTTTVTSRNSTEPRYAVQYGDSANTERLLGQLGTAGYKVTAHFQHLRTIVGEYRRLSAHSKFPGT